jgi:hypothetical protein
VQETSGFNLPKHQKHLEAFSMAKDLDFTFRKGKS